MQHDKAGIRDIKKEWRGGEGMQLMELSMLELMGKEEEEVVAFVSIHVV